MDNPIGIRPFRFTTEPLMFSFVFTGALSDAVVTNLLMRQTCWTYERVTLEECTGDKLTAAQRTTSYLEIGKMLIETLVPAFISFFLGPWSDINGRRKPLLFPTIGYIVSNCMWAILSLIPDLNPNYLMLCSIPVCLAGGFISLNMSAFCYLADVIGTGPKAMRMAVMEAASNSGQLLGFFLSPYLFHSIKNGYWQVFTVNAVILSLNFLYVYFYLPETIQVVQNRRKFLFSFELLKESFKTVTKKRSRHGRIAIIILILTSVLTILIVFGEAAVKYLSTWRQFGWNITQFTRYNTVFLLSIFSAIGLWFGKTLLHISDSALLLVSTLTRALSGILMGVSNSPTMLYIATIIGCLRSFTGPLIRSEISKIVPPEDIGKAFAFLTSAEAICPQLGIPIYASIYAEIIKVHPSSALSIFFISGVIMIFASIGLTIIMILRRGANSVSSSEE